MSNQKQNPKNRKEEKENRILETNGKQTTRCRFKPKHSGILIKCK